MADGPGTGPAPPASAPTSAPSSGPAPSSGGAAPAAPSKGPVGLAPAPPSGLQRPPDPAAQEAQRQRYPYKARIGDQEHEIDLADYRHRVKIDGQDYDLSLDELAKNQERLRSSMKRYEDASRLRKETEQRAAQVQEREKRLTAALSNPDTAFQLLRRTLGEEGLIRAAAALVTKRIDYERLPPEQREVHDRYSKQESELAQRRADLDRREAEIKRHQAEREARLTEEHRAKLLAEWVPALESAGLPAKINGEPNMRLVRMLAETIRVARNNNVPMTFSEALAEVKRDYEAMVGFATQRQHAASVAALEAQPGRTPPEAPGTPAKPRAVKRPMSAEEYARNLRRTWDKR